jgi:hypothetical protein
MLRTGPRQKEAAWQRRRPTRTGARRLPPRIEPRDDGAAVVVGVHGLADALAEVNRLLAAY